MKDPAFLFYSEAFIVGTMDMTDAEVGRYIRLLCRQHQNGFVRKQDLDATTDEVRKKFVEVDGGFVNLRLQKEVQKRRQYSESRSKNAKSKHTQEIRQIIDYLNKTLGTRYSPTTADTVRHINARLEEGYQFDDFRYVIDLKVKQWKGTDMEKYLRPSTLFGTKFESYRNEKYKSGNPFLDMIGGLNE